MIETIKKARDPTDFSLAVDYDDNQQLFFIFQNTEIKKPEAFSCNLDFVNRDIYTGEQLSFC